MVYTSKNSKNILSHSFIISIVALDNNFLDITIPSQTLLSEIVNFQCSEPKLLEIKKRVYTTTTKNLIAQLINYIKNDCLSNQDISSQTQFKNY